ncbi:hypothetical protein HG531_009500 [Fusarium graminearum]|nr:hypothetical protein HG531_009500 [Fusarium graminearum]
MLHDIASEGLKGIVKTGNNTSTRQLVELVEQFLNTFTDKILELQDTIAREVRLDGFSSLAVEVMVLRGEEGVCQVG